MLKLLRLLHFSLWTIFFSQTAAWNILIAGGTGPIGQALVSRFHDATSSVPFNVTILTRNSFLASTPTRVSHDYGWVGASFVQHFRSTMQLRDWDGGDLLDIVGKDWIGWQEDSLWHADCIVHCTGGGFTQQRVMACERLVRESLRLNPQALHITVNPTNELLSQQLSPGMSAIKQARIQTCEDMVQKNLPRSVCLRVKDPNADVVCDQIVAAMYEAAPSLQSSKLVS
jgi:hypothetical protein